MVGLLFVAYGALAPLAVGKGGGLIMQILGTNFSLTLGSWRLRFVLALEEWEEPSKEKGRAAALFARW